MDDAPHVALTAADGAELARLRHRAYGPDADIESDPAARARLAELERAHREARRSRRPEAAPAVPAGMDPASMGNDTASVTAHLAPSDPVETGRHAAPSADPVPGIEAAPAADAAPPVAAASRAHRHPRGLWGWVAAGAAGLAAVVLAATLVGELTANAPDVRLTQSLSDPPEGVVSLDDFPEMDLGFLGLEQPAQVRWRGAIGDHQVWTIEDGAGMRCIVTSFVRGYSAMGCAHDILPIAELHTDGVFVIDDERLGDVPDGSRLRLVWDGDAVDVYVERAGQPAQLSPRQPMP